MKKQVLFAILNRYADWESAYLASALQNRIKDKTAPYYVKTLSITKEPVCSLGGFFTIPDYAVHDCPDDYAALILIGGESWRTEEAKELLPLVRRAYDAGKLVGAICDATAFLGMNGLLNHHNHTSNGLEQLLEAAQPAYTNRDGYVHEQAVRDSNLITANGTGALEFTREVLLALQAYPADYIEENYQFFKVGFVGLAQAENQ